MSYSAASFDAGKIGLRRAVWKHIMATKQTQVLAANASLDIKPHDSPVGLGSPSWLLGSAAVFGFCIRKDDFAGSLIVSLSPDDTNFNQVLSFPLYGEGIMQFESGIELAGFTAKFTLWNGSAISTFDIWLEVRSS